MFDKKISKKEVLLEIDREILNLEKELKKVICRRDKSSADLERLVLKSKDTEVEKKLLELQFAQLQYHTTKVNSILEAKSILRGFREKISKIQ